NYFLFRVVVGVADNFGDASHPLRALTFNSRRDVQYIDGLLRICLRRPEKFAVDAGVYCVDPGGADAVLRGYFLCHEPGRGDDRGCCAEAGGVIACEEGAAEFLTRGLPQKSEIMHRYDSRTGRGGNVTGGAVDDVAGRADEVLPCGALLLDPAAYEAPSEATTANDLDVGGFEEKTVFRPGTVPQRVEQHDEAHAPILAGDQGPEQVE